jgi:hypothetical protein
MTANPRPLGCLALLALTLAGIPGAPAAGTIKCWISKEGLRECGNVVPPEYAQGGHTEVSGSGVMRETERAKTPEELEAERQRQEAERERQTRLAEQAAQDRVLLQTFSSEDDLVLTRNGKISVIESRIRLLESQIADLERNRLKLREAAAREERGGAGMSEALRQDLARVQRQLAEHLQFIADQRREQEVIRAQFAADLDRLRALKTGEARLGSP